MMTDILAMKFFLGIGQDHRGRYIFEYINATDDWLEITHDYIQWAFPNFVPGMNRYAPLMTNRLTLFIKTNPVAHYYSMKMFERMMLFYGFSFIKEGDRKGVCLKRNSFNRFFRWTTPHNHNYLRITRILLFMNSIGEQKWSSTLFLLLSRLDKKYNLFPDRTNHFWRSACFSKGKQSY